MQFAFNERLDAIPEQRDSIADFFSIRCRYLSPVLER